MTERRAQSAERRAQSRAGSGLSRGRRLAAAALFLWALAAVGADEAPRAWSPDAPLLPEGFGVGALEPPPVTPPPIPRESLRAKPFPPQAQPPPPAAFRPEAVTVAFSPRGQALELILRELRNARHSIDVAMFYLSHDDLIDALCSMAGKKVTVRVLTGSWMARPAHETTLERLAEHGVSVYVLGLPNHGRMHLKCAVIDQETVVTGAANWTPAAFEKNFEDTLLIRSPALARRYRRQIESLITRAERRESARYSQPSSTLPFPEVAALASSGADRFQAGRATALEDVRGAEVYFNPGRDGIDRLLGQLRAAEERIDVGMYLLNEPALLDALAATAGRGEVAVRVLLDARMLSGNLLAHVQRLWDAGAEVSYFRGQRASLHLKTAVIDNRYVWTGTANWTAGAAELNVEDMLLFDSPAMARRYTGFLDEIAARSHSFAPLALRREVAEAEAEAEYNQAGFLIGLPPTGPRTDYDGVDHPRPFEAFTANATVAYLPDEEYFPVLLDLIRDTHQSIFIAMYVFSETKTVAEHQERILRKLERAAERGVYVYLLLHSPAGVEDRLYRSHSNRAEELRERGIDVRLGLPGIQ